MSATLEPWADEVYVAGLEPRRRRPLGRVLVSVLDLWCANFGGQFELTRQGDVVVRRREDGVEELRIEVYSPDDAAETLYRVTEQLHSMAPYAFRAVWSVD